MLRKRIVHTREHSLSRAFHVPSSLSSIVPQAHSDPKHSSAMLRDHSPDASPSKLLTAQEPIPASRVGHQDYPFIHVICALAGTTTTLRLCITIALHSSGSYRFDTLRLLHVSQCIAVDILCI